MNYQDIWKEGKLVEKGERDCESRYQVIQNLVKRYKRPFTVLDIGMCDGYFTIRIAEEFPDSVCVAIEPRGDIVSTIRHLSNAIGIERRISFEDLKTLSHCTHFDIVLCLSVIHYLDNGNTYKETLEVVKQLGDHIILELPVEKRTLVSRYDEMHQLIEELGAPLTNIVSHVEENSVRPLYVLKGNPPSLRLT